MTSPFDAPPDKKLSRRRPRFGMRALLLLMLVCSVAGAAASYLIQALRGGSRGSHLVFLLFTLAGPVVLLLLLSLPARIRSALRSTRPVLRSSPPPAARKSSPER